MKRIVWRWEEQDFGFRFRSGKGKQTNELYQAGAPDDFYVVPRGQRKLSKAKADELAAQVVPPDSARVVAIPWRNYDRDWDWIETDDGICLNYAGCLNKEEIDRREDEGVARAMELVADLLERPEPVPIDIELVRRLHQALMGEIYPFAGEWRVVALHKGDGPTKWPLPTLGIGPLMKGLELQVFSRSPVISDDDQVVIEYISELMIELLSIHPFREGNGRMAFILANLVLMQNGLLRLDVYDRRRDQDRYYVACEAGRIHKDYAPLAGLIAEWLDLAIEKWEPTHE
ncbi:MAG: Fic family protein [Desulfomonilaceae bacterium]